MDCYRYQVISLLQRMALGGVLALVKVFVPMVASGNSKLGRVDQHTKLLPILSFALPIRRLENPRPVPVPGEERGAWKQPRFPAIQRLRLLFIAPSVEHGYTGHCVGKWRNN